MSCNYTILALLLQVRDERRNAEYLCLSYNPFVDVIGVGEENGNIKLYDEHTLQVEMCRSLQNDSCLG